MQHCFISYQVIKGKEVYIFAVLTLEKKSHFFLAKQNQTMEAFLHMLSVIIKH